MSNRWPVRKLLGISVDAMTMDQVLQVVDEKVSRRERLMIGVVNAAKIVNMRRNPELGEAVSQSDIILADGMPVVWASRLLRKPLPERVAGIDLMHRMLELSSRRGYGVYCLGATDEVLATAVQRMRAENPGVRIVGHRNGYYSDSDEPAVAEEIRKAKADILFVAMTSPKKERFLARWSDVIQVPICHGVGGSFDVLAGKVKRAPDLWQRWGLEWFYRVLQEPRRMWRRYLVTNTLFCVMLIKEFFTGQTRAKPA